ncbi:hypothetical protein GBA77_02850 [Bifidobacterium bifidum]|nr:hypothetical protein GBA75_02825 [Bifidobacterium bifidum]KAB6779137.1 hypothetical protein GBL21_12150 [Bifidobacterium longum]KAB7467748.1 hypothetical protein GBA85_02845 [Bifidobacterium bifidum]KAB7470107.1 hypothetical protein GBA88_04610 [Bifidobacterium bifidum]KAB7471242.1 hypothetical protein GBA82_04560 [Bifidobacterium bifidum]
MVVLPLTGGCRAERDWGRSQSVRKCAPKRQVREHMDAKGSICVRKCARSSFRRALTDANHLHIRRIRRNHQHRRNMVMQYDSQQ